MAFFVAVTRDFLGNKKADNYHVLVTTMLLAYRYLGCKMSIKLHFLHGYLDISPRNPRAVSVEQCERFHQDIVTMEHRYQGRWAETWWQTTAGASSEIAPRKSTRAGATSVNPCLNRANFDLVFCLHRHYTLICTYSYLHNNFFETWILMPGTLKIPYVALVANGCYEITPLILRYECKIR